MADPEHCYDKVLNRRLVDSDLPDRISTSDLAAFCAEHRVEFYTHRAMKFGEEGFRVATIEFPQRGVDVLWAQLRDWIKSVEELAPIRLAEAQEREKFVGRLTELKKGVDDAVTSGSALALNSNDLAFLQRVLAQVPA